MASIADDDFLTITMLVDQFLGNDPLSSVPFPPHLKKQPIPPTLKDERFKFAHHNICVRADVMVAVDIGRALTSQERTLISNKVKAFLKDHRF